MQVVQISQNYFLVFQLPLALAEAACSPSWVKGQ